MTTCFGGNFSDRETKGLMQGIPKQHPTDYYRAACTFSTLPGMMFPGKFTFFIFLYNIL